MTRANTFIWAALMLLISVLLLCSSLLKRTETDGEGS
mgnify:CR=1 FL=1